MKKQTESFKLALLKQSVLNATGKSLEEMADKAKSLQKRDSKGLLVKPCGQLGYCPYGRLVEQFPLPCDEAASELDADCLDYACSIYGHICPVVFVASVLMAFDELKG